MATYAIVREGRNADEIDELDAKLGFEVVDEEEPVEIDHQARIRFLREQGIELTEVA